MEAEILVPTDLNEIPLKSYQQFMDSYEKSNDEEFLCQKMVQIFCGLRLRDVFSVKWSDVKEITIHLSEMFKNKPSFQHKFTLQGVEFAFITDLENMSFGEYIDLTQNLDKVENWHKAMAVMYRPITERRKEKYKIEEYNGTNSYAEVMKFAPLGVVLGSQVFFWTLTNDLLQSLLTFLKSEMMTKEMKQTLAKELNLQNVGGGINQYMQLLTDNFKDLEMSPNYLYKTVLPGLLLKSKKEILNITKCSDN
tara:strand:- start:2696 stop:3448 length:753 start_codon:yes stop_codon:yes gene_type:complete